MGTVIVHKNGDKTHRSNYSYLGISLLSTLYKFLSNILLSNLSPYIDEFIGDHQCGSRSNTETTDKIFCIRQIEEKKWEYNETVHQLFVDITKAIDSVTSEVLCNILIELGITMKLVRLNKMCLKETYVEVRIGKYLSDNFPIQNGLIQGDALTPLPFKFTLD
jgi:hypothetical protein